MRTLTRLTYRAVAAAVAGYLFFSLTLLLSVIPEVVAGPYGFGRAKGSEVDPLVGVLCRLAPLEWLPTAGAPLVLWCVFRGSRSVSCGPWAIPWLALAWFVASGGLILAVLVNLNATWALHRPEPAVLTVGFNAAVVILLAASVVSQELLIWRERKSRRLLPPQSEESAS